MEDKRPEYLYHYTSAETLALILNSKKIRFNSLINVDDLEEAKTQNLKEAGKYCFVSCFTSSVHESIPIWSMYSNRGAGVRLKFSSDIFVDEATENRKKDVLASGKSVVENINNKLYFSFIGNSIYLKKVIYTDDDNLLVPVVKVDSTKMLHDCFQNQIGIYKRRCWQFQDEWRYIKYITPGNEADLNDNVDVYCSYIDIGIKDETLNELEVTLGYNISEGNRLIVHNLVESYNSKNKGAKIRVKESELKDKVR